MAIGVIVMLASYLDRSARAPMAAPGGPVTDFDQIVLGAQVALAGGDPYAVIGPERAIHWPWPLYFPMTALVVVLPFVALPLAVAGAVFFGLSAGILAYVVTRDSRAPLAWFVAAPFLQAMLGQQPIPLVTAGWFVSVLMGLGVAMKPTIGLAVLAGARRWRDVIVALTAASLIGLLSFALAPAWPLRWLDATRGAPHRIIALYPWGGWLTLLAVFRWRRPEARLLVVLSLVPQTVMAYAILPLMLVPRTPREHAVLIAGGTLAAALFARIGPPMNPLHADGFAWADRAHAVSVPLVVWLAYVPAVVMVLRRPNEVAT